MLFSFSTPDLIRHLWQLKTAVFLHWCLICVVPLPMEQCALINVNNHLIINIYSYLETSGGKSFNLYLNLVHFCNTSGNGRGSTVNRALDGSTYPG